MYLNIQLKIILLLNLVKLIYLVAFGHSKYRKILRKFKVLVAESKDKKQEKFKEFEKKYNLTLYETIKKHKELL